ncbi:unnamed protein product [Rotaria sp. Silwood1]|nr:unnamed protein product [Rotaria sp. Silwood1]
MELFHAISKANLNTKALAVGLDILKSSHIRKKKAAEYFGYSEPISRSYENKEIKTVKYTYVPFLRSLANYLQLPEVQADLHRVPPDYDTNCIQDTHDGIFARNHPDFQRATYLKIELNSDDLTVTNPISHRAHSIFFFYWSLLNVSREKRSKQTSKRLIAACPKWARKYNSLCHTIDDFLMGINQLSSTGSLKTNYKKIKIYFRKLGITININGNDVTYFGGLFISLGDYPAQMSLNGFKESVAATHFCHLCDIQHDNLEEDISYDFPAITLSQYRERKLYPGKMKFKFHFMTHFPVIMKDFGPLPYTSCLATERKHQFFKGNKVRNLKNPSLMLARRHELWICINDHSHDGSLSHTALSNGSHGVLDNRQPITDGQIQFVISNLPKLPFKPLSTLKTLTVKGYKYSHNSVLNVSKDHFPSLPIVGKIKWMLYDGNSCALICNMYTVKGYVQQLRAFEVQETNKMDCFILDDISYKKPLKLVCLNGSFYFPLHPYGKSFTTI